MSRTRLQAQNPARPNDPGTLLYDAVQGAAGSRNPVRLPADRALLVADHRDARRVLTDLETFSLPFNVSRKRIHAAAARDPRPSRPLTPTDVAAGRAAFAAELDDAWSRSHHSHAYADVGHEAGSGVEIDALVVLRDPVAVATTTALLPEASDVDRRAVAAAALAWIDSLGPVISAKRPPRRWSKVRRTEHNALAELLAHLEDASVSEPRKMAVALAAGIQVPIAAGAWLTMLLVEHPDVRAQLREGTVDASAVVWECLRLYPPTWMLPRVTSQDVRIADLDIPAVTALVISPVALGQDPGLVPGPEEGCAPLRHFSPSRWSTSTRRPGAWLPFGAGPRACPGRNLGMGQLTVLADFLATLDLAPNGPFPAPDVSRGLSPAASTLRVHGTFAASGVNSAGATADAGADAGADGS